MNAFPRIPPRRLRAILASAIGLSALALIAIGYRAVSEWQHAAALVASRRAEAAADLLVSALSHDMRGAHASVLATAVRDSPSLVFVNEGRPPRAQQMSPRELGALFR